MAQRCVRRILLLLALPSVVLAGDVLRTQLRLPRRLSDSTPHARQAFPPFDRGVLGRPGAGNISARERLRHARGNTVVAGIRVGTPPQPMQCLVDSGSSDLWVPSTRCESCTNAHHFRADRSSTFHPHMEATPEGQRPKAVHIAYGSGEIVGYNVQDTVVLGEMKLPSQDFVIVEDAALPPHRTWDGICGLGWRQLASAGQPLYKHLQQLGGRAVFGLVPGGAGKAFISVGSREAEASCRPGTLSWMPAESLSPGGEPSFWVTTGGLAIHRKRPVTSRFLVDTGTTFLLAPPGIYGDLVRSIFPRDVFEARCGVDPSAGGLVVCDCGVVDAPGMLPMRVQLGGREFVLPVEKLFQKVHARDGGQELCLLQVQENPMAPPEPAVPVAGIPGGLAGILGGLGGEGPGRGAEASPWEGGAPVPPFPFPMPGFGGPEAPFPMPGFAPGGDGGAGGERVERISTMQPDGSVCTETRVWEGDRLTQSRKECEQPGEAGEADAWPFPEPWGGRRLQAEGAEPLWILGGVFLEHFVAIFDFDAQRLGFCEPAAGDGDAGGAAGADGSAPWSATLLGDEVGPAQGGGAAGSASVALAMAALSLVVAMPFLLCGALRARGGRPTEDFPLVGVEFFE